MDLLRIQDLRIKLKKQNKVLVDKVSFSIKEGECFGIVGQSGSGKTLSCKSIMRLLNESVFSYEGKILFEGQDVLSMKQNEVAKFRGRKIAMIFQNPMTAFAPNIKIGKQIKMSFLGEMSEGRNRLNERISEVLESVNLRNTDEILHSYPDELSGGMLQRVMIAIVLLQKPLLLIADEVTTALDCVSEHFVLEELKKLRDAGISLMVITHDIAVASYLCDKIAVMKDGAMIECGLTKDVINHPQNQFTKELVATSVLLEGKKC